MLIDRRLLAPEPDAGGGPVTTATPATPATPEATVATVATVAPEPSTPEKPAEAPQTLQEAMWGKEGLAEAKEPKPALEEPKPGEKLQADKPQAKPEQKQVPQMPKDLSPEGQARFKQLVSLVKERDQQLGQFAQRAEQAERKVGEFTSILKESGATAEDFAVFVELSHAMRSQNFPRAKQIVMGMVRELSLATGENLTGSNELLSEFPDLAEKVAGMQMSEEAALELAKHRRTAERQNRDQQAYAQQQKDLQTWTQHRDQSMQKINQMIASWKSTDIDFARKENKIAERVNRLKEFHPSTWPQKVQELYDDLTDAVTTFGTSPQGEGPRPLRGGTAPSKTTKDPATMHEAMWNEPKPA